MNNHKSNLELGFSSINYGKNINFDFNNHWMVYLILRVLFNKVKCCMNDYFIPIKILCIFYPYGFL